jgi:hypothetical protein
LKKTREEIDKKIIAAGWAVQDEDLINLFEKLRVAVREGARVKKVNQGEFFYVRHSRNSWEIAVGEFIKQQAWSKVNIPKFIPVNDLQFYKL